MASLVWQPFDPAWIVSFAAEPVSVVESMAASAPGLQAAQALYVAACGALLAHSLLVQLGPRQLQLLDQRGQSRPRRRPPVTWSLAAQLFLQLCIVGYSTHTLISLGHRHASLALEHWSHDLLRIALPAASATAAVTNTVSLLLGHASTARALYHLFGAFTWTWINSIDPSLLPDRSVNLHLAILFPWLLALAFLLDVFYAPPDHHHVLLPSTAYTGVEQISFRWLTRIIDTKTALSLDILPDNTSLAPDESYLAALRLAAHAAIESDTPGNTADALFWSFIRRQHPHELAYATLLRLACDLSIYAVPWQLKALLQHPTSVNVMILFCSRSIGALAGNYSGLFLRSLSIRYRSALSVLLHDKTLVLGDAKSDASALDLAVLAEADTMTLYRCAQTYPDIWSFPLQVILCLGGLACLLPWQAFFAVIALVVLMSPVLGSMLRSVGFWTSANMTVKDKRTRLIREVLDSITAVKMHAWESAMARLIAGCRREELKTMQRTAQASAGIVAYMQSMPSALTVVAFGTMLLLRVSLTNGLTFTLIMLFTMLNASLTQVSSLASNIQLIKTSSARLSAYLNLPEEQIEVEVDSLPDLQPWAKDSALTACTLRVGWPGREPLISGGSLVIPPGSLSAITGPMGVGKSTLLLALARHAQKQHRVAFVGQKPVMVGGSIRDNILFGRLYDAQLYSQVVQACCLDADIGRLHHGDLTLVAGTSSLSGGQCARICLARAAYSQADLYALDDPLAALDVRVSAAIVRNLLGPSGLLARSTRIICTSHPLVLAHATFSYSIEDSTLRLLEPRASLPDESLRTTNEYSDQAAVSLVLEARRPGHAPAHDESRHPTKLASHYLFFNKVFIVAHTSQAPIVDIRLAEEALEEGSVSSTSLASMDEKRAPSRPRGAIYAYLSSCRKLGWPLAISTLLLARMSSISSTYVLKTMAAQTDVTDLFQCLGLFGLLSLSQGACFYMFIYVLYTLCIIPAASLLHAQLTAGVLRHSLSYFQTTPLANILNLFTNDIGRVDTSLNGSIASLVAQYVNLALSCGVLIMAMPVSLLFVVPLLAACHYVQQAYLVKLRELRHLDAESRAPLLECLREAESGRVLFSIHHMQERQRIQFDDHIAYNVRAVWPMCCTDLWIAVRLEILSIVLQVLAAGALLATSVEPGVLGFVMTYVFQVTGTLSNIAKVTAQFESDAVSVSRVAEASHIDVFNVQDTIVEPSSGLLAPYSDSDPAQTWPQHGRVEFRRVSARHRPGLPETLNSISFIVNPGEKVAIIGRTGAGKSSMMLALLKLMDQTAGQILIDDVDVAGVSESRLRTSLAVVPQAQLFFSGSVRQNLDPLGLADDERILEALRICGGLPIVQKMMGSHETMQQEGAALLDAAVGPQSSLSKGELQLLLLARAVIQQSRVLVMDEATSGMDMAGEMRCHDVIFGELRDTTTLAVLHRLELTLHYDKVLVLGEGKVVAFDAPAALLGSREGPYYEMVAESPDLLQKALAMYGIEK